MNDQKAFSEECYIAGWGVEYYEAGFNPTVLREAAVPIIDIGTCAKWFLAESQSTGVNPLTAGIKIDEIIERLESITDKSRLTEYNDPITQDAKFDNLPDTRLICAGYIYGSIDSCQVIVFKKISINLYHLKTYTKLTYNLSL
jgi:hypothetical protein